MIKKGLKILFSFTFILVYSLSIFCFSVNTQDFSKRKNAVNFEFIQLQNVIAIHAIKLQNPISSVFLDNYFSFYSTFFKINYLKNKLFSITITKNNSFLCFLSKYFVLKDYCIIIPFHYFY